MNVSNIRFSSLKIKSGNNYSSFSTSNDQILGDKPHSVFCCQYISKLNDLKDSNLVGGKSFFYFGPFCALAAKIYYSFIDTYTLSMCTLSNTMSYGGLIPHGPGDQSLLTRRPCGVGVIDFFHFF